MDSTLSQIMKEQMNKEHRMQKILKEKQLAEKARVQAALGITPVKQVPIKRVSSQLNFLDQSLGMEKNPHSYDGKPKMDSDPQRILRFGVSSECQGRYAYLKLESRKGGPAERYGRPLTTAQEVGWTSTEATKIRSVQPFAHRPLLNQQMYRPMGAESCLRM